MTPEDPRSTSEKTEKPRVPEIILPKGGGALRSIDEKFSVNAENGGCDLSVPLPFSKTRSGLDSSLALRYSSGAGNSAFGVGWSLTLPSIRRRTDRRLPRYDDAGESDVFVFSGAEDLVPAYRDEGGGNWVRDSDENGGVRVERYRPRIEGLFARIEKITVDGEEGFYWKVTTRDNVSTLFGRTDAARIREPGDGSRIAVWLPEWSWDDKGNCYSLFYKDEDLLNVPDVVEEKNRRAGLAPFANKYLKRIRYGNRTPYAPDHPHRPTAPAAPSYFFDAIIDYGEHDDTTEEVRTWPCRFDPFSDCRSGFEMRSYRLCKRILFFHSIPELDPLQPVLVRWLDLRYRHFAFDATPYRSEEADFITSLRAVNVRGGVTAALPPLDLVYQELDWNETVSSIAADEIEGAPGGVSGPYQWLDLHGEGAPGILSEQAQALYFKENEGEGRFGAPRPVSPKASFAGVASGSLQFQDLGGDGSKQLVSMTATPRGYFAIDDEGEWQPFRAFDRLASDLGVPNARFIDLDGDGKPDLVVSEELAFRWYPSLGTGGFDGPRLAAKAADEERGPAVLFADPAQTIFIADMNGDGLADIVRVRNGEVTYWPSLGYGRFGAKVTMRNPPTFDSPERFDPSLIQLADVSGTGATDLIYLGGGGFRAWINLAGNAWSDAQAIDPFPGTERPNRVSVLDLLGNGTASLVWSSDLPANASAPIRYVDLMGGRKPYVLARYSNGFGKTVSFQYRSSTHFALRDKREGRPWATRLPFPTMCVSRVETTDAVSGRRYVQEYRYRHGYYDHEEREFRGFGMVEETDTESYDRFVAGGGSNVVDASLHQPPVRTRTWYHTGAFVRGARILDLFAGDYYQGPFEEALRAAVIETPMTPSEMRQAARACKGTMLRQEVFADDGTPAAAHPYSTTTRNCVVRMLQPTLGNDQAVLLAIESEVITRHYEREPADPRVGHTVNTVVDERGNVVESATIAYARAVVDGTLDAGVQQEQARVLATYAVHGYTNDVDAAAAWRVRQRSESRVYELTGITPLGTRFTPDEIRVLFVGALPRPFEAPATPPLVEKRLIRHERTLYSSDADPNLALPPNVLQSRGLEYEKYNLAFTPSLRTSLYGTRVSDAMLGAARYVQDPDGAWWIPSGRQQYFVDPALHFYLPERYLDPYGAATTVRYFSDHHLLIDRTTDALGAATTVLDFDWRVLQPRTMRDINDNITETVFDIHGLVVGSALRGKGAEADDLVGFVADLSSAQGNAFFADPAGSGAALLQHASSRFVYRFDVVPAVAARIDRETHHAGDGLPRLRYSFEYTDGHGGVAMKKAQAEPGMAKTVVLNGDGTYAVAEVDTTPALRWIGSGRTVVNNKGKPVMQYEPYFSVTHAYETAPELVESGVTPVTHYDPVDRVIRTDRPDGSFSRVEIRAWRQLTFDECDTVLESDWHAARIGGALGPQEQIAAQKSALHANTPGTAHFDTLGRVIHTVAHNRFVDRVTLAIVDESYGTRTFLDAEGRTLAVRDPRGNMAVENFHDLHGRPCRTISDRGEQRALQDAIAKEIYTWDAKGNRIHTLYDVLHRPTDVELLTAANLTTIIEKSVYGVDPALNQNGKLIAQFDDSGVVEHTSYDFKGNTLESGRRFTASANADVDWTTPAAVALGAPLVTTNVYDALSRVVTTASPDGSLTAQGYTASGLLGSVTVAIRGGAPTPFITRVDHDAKGQRALVAHGNGVTTAFTYDPKTFRVRRIRSVRTSDSASRQDLQYAYDPRGNIISIRDLAQQTVYFNNQIVAPHNEFTYDALYRIVEATGREHIAGNAPPSRDDAPRTNLPHPADGNALQRYRQQYEYDASGNMRAMVHSAGAGPFLHQWTRTFTPEGASDRLASSVVGVTNEAFTYDAHGNLETMTGFGPLAWDVRDRFRGADLGGGGTARYTYDRERARVRKIVARPGNLVEERLYIGAVEIFTRTLNGALALRRETLQVMDGPQRLAMVDTRTDGPGPGPAQLIRYQYANHLGTAALELDHDGDVIAYEEFHPYGSTSLQSVDAAREVPARRYRYTGKERDEESGFSYHAARYYAPWLARWTSSDPAGLVDGTNVHRYARDNPVVLNDPNGTDPPAADPPSDFDVGPVRFHPRYTWLHLEEGGPTNPELRTLLTPGRVFGGDLQFRGDWSFPLLPSLTGTARGEFDVGFSRPPFAADALTATGYIDLRIGGVFPIRISGSASGFVLPDERTFRLTQPFAQGRPGYSFENPGVRFGELSYSGWLGFPTGETSTFGAARIWGDVQFGSDTGGVSGTFHVLPIPPLAFAWGSFSNSASGFSATGNYIGPQFGPIGIGVDVDPFRALHDPKGTPSQLVPDQRPALGGHVEVFQPGFSIGYTRFWVQPGSYSTFAVGVAPLPGVEQVAPGQRSLPIPGITPLLYGRDITTPIGSYGVYGGAAYRLWW